MSPPTEPHDPHEGFGAIAWGVGCLVLAIVVGLVVAMSGGDEAPAAAAPTPPNPEDPDAQTIRQPVAPPSAPAP